MHRKMHIYFPFLRAGIQQAITYRIDFLSFFIGNIFTCFILYFLWKAVFISHHGSTFMSFSMNDMIVYLFITNITGYITHSDVTGNIGNEIKNGNFSMRLIKPISYDLSLMFSEIGSTTFILSIFLVPMVIGVEIYRYFTFGKIMFNPLNFAEFLISSGLGYILSFYLSACFGYCMFFVMNVWGFSLLKNVLVSFLSGSMIPIAFFPQWAQNILNILPFSSLSYTPVMLYMGKYDTVKTVQSIILQAIWIILLWALSKIIWHSAIKRVTVQGG